MFSKTFLISLTILLITNASFTPYMAMNWYPYNVSSITNKLRDLLAKKSKKNAKVRFGITETYEYTPDKWIHFNQRINPIYLNFTLYPTLYNFKRFIGYTLYYNIGLKPTLLYLNDILKENKNFKIGYGGHFVLSLISIKLSNSLNPSGLQKLRNLCQKRASCYAVPERVRHYTYYNMGQCLKMEYCWSFVGCYYTPRMLSTSQCADIVYSIFGVEIN